MAGGTRPSTGSDTRETAESLSPKGAEKIDSDEALAIIASTRHMNGSQLRFPISAFGLVAACLPVFIFNLAAQPACVPLPAGLVSWWRGESNAVDQIGGNHGGLSGNTTY